MKALAALTLGVLLAGCMPFREEYKPPPKEPCTVPVYVDGEYHHCVPTSHVRRTMEDMTK